MRQVLDAVKGYYLRGSGFSDRYPLNPLKFGSRKRLPPIHVWRELDSRNDTYQSGTYQMNTANGIVTVHRIDLIEA
jgi:hypothetical protein